MASLSGLILIWSGAIVDIPAGWFLCDGNNGTPDLRNRFIVGAGDVYSVDDTGGSFTHQHTITPDAIALQAGTLIQDIDPAGDYDNVTNAHDHGGAVSAASSLPFYYALAYIMKG